MTRAYEQRNVRRFIVLLTQHADGELVGRDGVAPDYALGSDPHVIASGEPPGLGGAQDFLRLVGRRVKQHDAGLARLQVDQVVGRFELDRLEDREPVYLTRKQIRANKPIGRSSITT